MEIQCEDFDYLQYAVVYKEKLQLYKRSLLCLNWIQAWTGRLRKWKYTKQVANAGYLYQDKTYDDSVYRICSTKLLQEIDMEYGYG